MPGHAQKPTHIRVLKEAPLPALRPGRPRDARPAGSGRRPRGPRRTSRGAVGSYQLLDENCTGHPLAPAATCTLQVRFRPLSEGVKTASLGLFGESDGGTQVILTGVGSAPEPAAYPPASAGSSANAGTVAGPPAPRLAKPHRRRPRIIRRRHRRADLHVAHRVLGADTR
jgi:hypothetical protein